MSHMCVSATVRSATDNGFMSTVACGHGGDARLAGCDGRFGDDTRRTTINRITLAALSDRFAWIIPKASEIR